MEVQQTGAAEILQTETVVQYTEQAVETVIDANAVTKVPTPALPFLLLGIVIAVLMVAAGVFLFLKKRNAGGDYSEMSIDALDEETLI